MNTSLHVNTDTKVRSKLYESSCIETIKYRAWLEVQNVFKTDNWRYHRESLEVWFDDMASIDTMIEALNQLKKIRQNELNAIVDYSDKVESIKAVC